MPEYTCNWHGKTFSISTSALFFDFEIQRTNGLITGDTSTGLSTEEVTEAYYIFIRCLPNFLTEELTLLEMSLVSCVKCHLSTIVMIIRHQFEDRCHNSMHQYVNIVSKSVYHCSNVLFRGVLSNHVHFLTMSSLVHSLYMLSP